jgi:hypothetical protein
MDLRYRFPDKIDLIEIKKLKNYVYKDDDIEVNSDYKN